MVARHVASFDFLASTGTLPVGTALAGVLVGPLGLQPLLLGMSAAGVAIAVACLADPAVRALSRPPDAPGRASPAPARP